MIGKEHEHKSQEKKFPKKEKNQRADPCGWRAERPKPYYLAVLTFILLRALLSLASASL